MAVGTESYLDDDLVATARQLLDESTKEREARGVALIIGLGRQAEKMIEQDYKLTRESIEEFEERSRHGITNEAKENRQG